MPRLTNNCEAFIRSRGQLFLLHGVFTSQVEANAYMDAHETAALLCTDEKGHFYITDINPFTPKGID